MTSAEETLQKNSLLVHKIFIIIGLKLKARVITKHSKQQEHQSRVSWVRPRP